MASLGTEASSNVEMPITELDGISKPIMMGVGRNSSPAVTAAGDMSATAETSDKEADDSVSKSLEATDGYPQKAEQATKQVDNKTTQKDGLLADADTKIEVTTEPSREFTIKPQVVNPVKSDAGVFSSNQANVVTEISSADDASVGSDTSGSQNADQSAALFASDSNIKQANQTQAARSASQIDDSIHERIIDQIVKEVKMIKLPQRTDLVVRLTPPELGSLRVQISQSANGMMAQIETSGDQVKSLLQAHLPALNQAFSDAGLKMDSVSVTSGTSFGSLMQDTAQGSAQQQYSGQRRYYGNSQDSSGSQNMINMPINSAALDMNQGYSWLA
jgi:flagellar hook-length control protein FliK